jgi:2-octaprenyl-6-methoxyphenol hydroxylase
MPTTTDTDVLIAGGGLVGLSLALLLSGSGMRIRVVDRLPLDEPLMTPDERHLALSEVTCRTLETLSVLQALGADAETIRGLHVSSAGEFGAVRWDAATRGFARFGVVAPAQRLLAALRRLVLERADIVVTAPAAVDHARAGEHEIVVDVNGARVSTRLLVIADGAESRLRADAGIDVQRHDYGCMAVCCVVDVERAHQGVAYERFTRTGPVAMLPQPRNRCGSIYVVDAAAGKRLMGLSEPDYLKELQAAFGYRLGRLRAAGQRVGHPLRRVYAERLTAPRQVLIGNAAQSLHPVGAQGFNLGLRDAATLAEALLAAWRLKADPGAETLLADYAAKRAGDRAATAGLSHALAQGTTLKLAPAGWVRSLALLAADRLEPVAEHLLLGGMGFRGGTPAIARQQSDSVRAQRRSTGAATP